MFYHSIFLNSIQYFEEAKKAYINSNLPAIGHGRKDVHNRQVNYIFLIDWIFYGYEIAFIIEAQCYSPTWNDENLATFV